MSRKSKKSPRVAQKYARVQREILAAAQRHLLERGVDAVTLESVAGDLGMTKQALYYYFPSKEALMRSLITTFLNDEIEVLTSRIESDDSRGNVLGTLIRSFHAHYIDRLDAFRSVYCQSQLYSGSRAAIDKETVEHDINPRTRHLFDVLEARLAEETRDGDRRLELRRLAFVAWLSALGLMTMLGVADAADDPLVHSDEELLEVLERVFANAIRDRFDACPAE